PAMLAASSPQAPLSRPGRLGGWAFLRFRPHPLSHLTAPAPAYQLGPLGIVERPPRLTPLCNRIQKAVIQAGAVHKPDAGGTVRNSATRTPVGQRETLPLGVDDP